MKRAVLRLVAANYCQWLAERLLPSEKPVIYDLQARFIVLIDSLTENPEIDLSEPLDGKGIQIALDWMFATANKANIGNSWVALAISLMRVYASEHIGEIIAKITAIPSPNNGGTK